MNSKWSSFYIYLWRMRWKSGVPLWHRSILSFRVIWEEHYLGAEFPLRFLRGTLWNLSVPPRSLSSWVKGIWISEDAYTLNCSQLLSYEWWRYYYAGIKFKYRRCLTSMSHSDCVGLYDCVASYVLISEADSECSIIRVTLWAKIFVCYV